MKKGIMAALAVLFILSLAGSAWSLSDTSGNPGFSPEDYSVPEAIKVVYDRSEPQYTSTIQGSPDIGLQFSIGALFEDYGGALKVQAKNDGIRELFLQSYRFEWMGTGETFEKDVYLTVGRGDTVDVGIIGLDGPSYSGAVDYRMAVKVFQVRGGEYLKYTNNGDDWIPFEIGTVNVDPLGSEIDYDYRVNSDLYFNRANELVNLDSTQVSNAVLQSAQFRKFPDTSQYNYDKLCAIFDYVDAAIEYTSEPNGSDIWQRPETCLSTGTGDCEDYSLLISAMVYQVGGTPRMFLIDGHAFAAVYIGNTSQDVDAARTSIESYYDTQLKIHTIEDERGHWLIADPLGSFHLGGLSVSASPTEEVGGEWEWFFDETPVLHAIDITGEVAVLPLWELPVFWMTMLLISGSLLILGILGQTEEKAHVVENCAVCGAPVEEPEAGCQYCGLQLHEVCSDGVVVCPGCGNYYKPPPPPGNY